MSLQHTSKAIQRYRRRPEAQQAEPSKLLGHIRRLSLFYAVYNRRLSHPHWVVIRGRTQLRDRPGTENASTNHPPAISRCKATQTLVNIQFNFSSIHLCTYIRLYVQIKRYRQRHTGEQTWHAWNCSNSCIWHLSTYWFLKLPYPYDGISNIHNSRITHRCVVPHSAPEIPLRTAYEVFTVFILYVHRSSIVNFQCDAEI